MYEAVLIELRKENAPNVLLEDFNYFANKAINQYINKRYNIYDINQQTTDDLRVLKSTALLSPIKVNNYEGLTNAHGATYSVDLPSDYLHMLNCICVYKLKRTYKCYDKGDTWRAAATRLTADAYSQVLDNFWNKPTYKRPYYYLHNVNTNDYIPTSDNDADFQNIYKVYEIPENEVKTKDDNTGYVLQAKYYYKDSTFNTTGKFWSTTKLFTVDDEKTVEQVKEESYQNKPSGIGSYKEENPKIVITSWKNNVKEYFDKPNYAVVKLEEIYDKDFHGNPIVQGELDNTYVVINSNNDEISNIERGASIRYGNSTKVRCEIRYGTDDSIFKLIKVYIDYIKAPQNIRLTQKEIDYTEDRSQVLEYPDYVCQEIINELVHIIMENISDQRLQTHPVVSQSIANPVQQQTEPVAQPQ